VPPWFNCYGRYGFTSDNLHSRRSQVIRKSILADDDNVPYVVVTYRGREVHRHEFDQPVTIGRELSCDLWVGDAKLSRQHCRIEPDEDHWVVRDLGSRNGIYLRDLRVKKFVARDSETFVIGDTEVIFHAGSFRVARPATPLDTHHQSLMSPLVGKVSDHEAPALAAKTTRFRARPMPMPRPRLTSEADEPLTKPFSLAFQRPAPRPILAPETPAVVMEEKPVAEQSRSWFSTLFGRKAS
jgi:pSer/pThr/pTyr-binding forkhead associated (FHA) protein